MIAFTFLGTITFKLAEEAELWDLQKQLMPVVDWFDLGIQLNIPMELMQEIEQDYLKTKGKRLGMLMQWKELQKPTWGKVVQALINIDQRAIAKTIAENHGNKINYCSCMSLYNTVDTV